MSYNLLPLETEGIDCEMNLPWWSEKSIPEATTKLLLGIKKTLPLLKPLEGVDMNEEETIHFPLRYLMPYRSLLMNTEDEFVRNSAQISLSSDEFVRMDAILL